MCRKDVLIAEMAYFRTYITSGDSSDDIDISVHCDIHIFEWLVHYLQVCGLGFVVCGLWFVVCGLWFVACAADLLQDPLSPPKLDSANVISILISSQAKPSASTPKP